MPGRAAVFLESTFLGLWVFGWGKLSRRVHLLCIWLVAFGTVLSAAFIMAANSWMQHLVGYTMVNGKPQLDDIWAVLSNPVFLWGYTHVLLASAVTASLVMLAVSAWQIRGGGGGRLSPLQAQYAAKYGPGYYVPNIFIQYWSMRGMACLAGLIFLLGLWELWRRKARPSRWFLWCATWAVINPFLRFRVWPETAIALKLAGKKPGAGWEPQMEVLSFAERPGEDMRPYDRLIGAALDGDRWLFARQDTVEAAWRVVDPILGDALPSVPSCPAAWHDAAG